MTETVDLQPYQAARSDQLPDRALHWLKTSDSQVAIACARGHLAFLDPAHEIADEIADDGTIHPSLVCPEESCDWHVFGRLKGWTP